MPLLCFGDRSELSKRSLHFPPQSIKLSNHRRLEQFLGQARCEHIVFACFRVFYAHQMNFKTGAFSQEKARLLELLRMIEELLDLLAGIATTAKQKVITPLVMRAHELQTEIQPIVNDQALALQ